MPPEMRSLDHPSLNPMAEDAPSHKELGCKRIMIHVADKDLLVEKGKAYYEAVKKSGWEGDIELVQSDGEEHVFHLTNPDGDKVLQLVHTLLKGLKKIAISADIPMLVYGDFSSVPGSAPLNSVRQTLLEAAEGKRKLNGASNGAVDDLENDSIAEDFGSNTKKNYSRAVSSASSIKQVKVARAVIEKKTVDLSVWKLKIERQVANQVNHTINSITSTFMKFIPNLQEKLVASPTTPHTEGASNLGDPHINNNVVVTSTVTPTVSHNDLHSSTMEKKYVMLLSHDLEKEVAKGYVATQTVVILER